MRCIFFGEALGHCDSNPNAWVRDRLAGLRGPSYAAIRIKLRRPSVDFTATADGIGRRLFVPSGGQ